MKVNQLHSVISNRDINLTALRLLLLSVVDLYGSEIWDCTKYHSIRIHSLRGSKEDSRVFLLFGVNLKWWHKVCRQPNNWYPPNSCLVRSEHLWTIGRCLLCLLCQNKTAIALKRCEGYNKHCGQCLYVM